MEHNVHITAVAHGGHGVARIDGQVCFVPYGLPGDVARIVVERRQKSMLWGRIVNLIEPSPHRIEAHEAAALQSGSAMWLHFAYPAQADWKTQIVRDCFTRIGKIAVEPVWHEMPDLRVNYRTRAEFHIQDRRIGYYRYGTHEVVDIAACPLSHPRLNDALARLRRCAPAQSVEITVNPEDGDTLVWTRRHDAEVVKQFPHAQHLKSSDARAQFILDGVPIVNGSFSQSSLLLNRMLRSQVHEHLSGAGSVIDVYCGSGNFSITLPQSVHVLGVDHNRAAIAAADTVRPGSYRVAGDTALPAAIGHTTADVIVLDPPRVGAKNLVPALAQARAARIVYVSCDPATLARDCGMLINAGWHPTRLDLLDMFPNTPHVECVCRLERS